MKILRTRHDGAFPGNNPYRGYCLGYLWPNAGSVVGGLTVLRRDCSRPGSKARLYPECTPSRLPQERPTCTPAGCGNATEGPYPPFSRQRESRVRQHIAVTPSDVSRHPVCPTASAAYVCTQVGVGLADSVANIAKVVHLRAGRCDPFDTAVTTWFATCAQYRVKFTRLVRRKCP